MRLLCCSALALAALVAVAGSPAGAKDFKPGDLKICNADSCVPLLDRKLLKDFSLFFYPPGKQPAEVRKPRIGAPYFQIRSGTYVAGIAATAQLDRFRTSCQCGHFGPDDWYRVPDKVALKLRKLAAKLQPLRVTESTIDRTRYG